MGDPACVGIGIAVGTSAGFIIMLVLYFVVPWCDVSTDAPITYSSYGRYAKVAVATDAGRCSTIGAKLLAKNGSFVDAAIGATLCVGILNAHSTSIGGGCFISIYDAKNRKSVFINARDVAPEIATETMYNGKKDAKRTGALSIAVPGEIAGYWKAHQLYGKLNWSELFEPAVELALEGANITPPLADALSYTNLTDNVKDWEYNLEPIYVGVNGSPKKDGDFVVRPELGTTLRYIAKGGEATFYSGLVMKQIIKDLRDAKGGPSIITEEDMRTYRVKEQTFISIKLGDLLLLTPGAPSGGPVLCYILNILKGYNFSPKSVANTAAKVLTYHRILEAFKFAYSKRGGLGDPDFDTDVSQTVQEMIDDEYAEETRLKINDTHTQNKEYYGEDYLSPPEDFGTTHVSVVGEDGSAVSITSSLNRYLGSNVRGLRTGIIFNNNMDDFSLSGEESLGNNFIWPGKRPLSSMAPTIILNPTKTDQSAVKIVVGASGGIKIPTAIAWTIMNMLWFGKGVDEAVNEKRLHHEFNADNTKQAKFEEGFDDDVVKGLEGKGHIMEPYKPIESVVQVIERIADGKFDAKSDDRKKGYPDGY